MKIGDKIEFAIMGEFSDHVHKGNIISVPVDEEDSFEVKVTQIAPMHENFGDLVSNGMNKDNIIYLNDFEIRLDITINEI